MSENNVIQEPALFHNIRVARTISSKLATTLGPKGMDKMLIAANKSKMITNDGATIIQNMQIEHPIGEMLTQIARTQDEEVGDGTTTSIVLTGFLLEGALMLMEKGIHPQKIIEGYETATKKAKEYYADISEPYNNIEQLIRTTLTGKIANEGSTIETLAEALSDKPNKDSVKILKIKGNKGLYFVNGFIIDKEIINQDMPKNGKGVKILLLDKNMEVRQTDANTQININNSKEFEEMLSVNEKLCKNIIKDIAGKGVNLILTTGVVNEFIEHYATASGIAIIKRVKNDDMDLIANVTGANIVSTFNFTKNDLGSCDYSTSEEYGEEYVTISSDSNIRTIVIRGSNDTTLDEMERCITDSIKVIDAIRKDNMVVYGGGSCELSVANKLRKFSLEYEDMTQLIIDSYANTLEAIPIQLARSSGSNDLKLFVEARSKNKNNYKIGIGVMTGNAEDMKKLGVIEPLRIKTQALQSAMEVCKSILRVDDMLIARV